MLRETPFHSRTTPLNQMLAWRDWSGYAAASQYEPTHLREYTAVRNSAALFDVSPLFKYEIAGPDAEKLLARMLVRDVRACRVGQACYTCWCDDNGDVLDDGLALRLEPQRFRLTAAHPNLRWLELLAVGLDVAVADVSEQYGILALQGPTARAILQQLAPAVGALRPFELCSVALAGQTCLVSRTGYTGDLGYELWAPTAEADDPLRLWDLLQTAGADYGLTPAGMAALDTARVEAGLLLIDVDYESARHTWTAAQKSSVLDLGLGWMARRLEQDDRPFIGRARLERELQTGARWAFKGIVVDWEAVQHAWNHHGRPAPHNPLVHRASIPIYRDGEWVGYATSSVYSPLLKAFLALATLQPAVAQAGTAVQFELTVEHARVHTPARVVDLPFFDPPRRRAKSA